MKNTSKSVTPKAKVLIVDDELLMREVLKIMLSDFDTVEASNGREAVEVFKKEKPDIVLMDIRMPIMDGIKAIKEILRICPEAKIVALTAYTTSKGDEIVEAGARAILKKPITKKRLYETLVNLLRE